MLMVKALRDFTKITSYLKTSSHILVSQKNSSGPKWQCGLFNKSTTSETNSKRFKTTSTEKEEPFTFSSSNAASWKTADTISGGVKRNAPAIEPLVIIASVAVFLIYFCILREENDIDLKLKLALGDHVEGLDETTMHKLKLN